MAAPQAEPPNSFAIDRVWLENARSAPALQAGAIGCEALQPGASACVLADARALYLQANSRDSGLVRTRILADTVGTMYVEEVTFLLPDSADRVGLRESAEGIGKVELTSEQSDITPAQCALSAWLPPSPGRDSQSRRVRLQLCECAMDIERSNPVSIAPVRYVLLPLANLVTGYTVKAMQRKIERGDRQEGKVWRRAPDGRVTIDLVGYEKWAESR